MRKQGVLIQRVSQAAQLRFPARQRRLPLLHQPSLPSRQSQRMSMSLSLRPAGSHTLNRMIEGSSLPNLCVNQTWSQKMYSFPKVLVRMGRCCSLVTCWTGACSSSSFFLAAVKSHLPRLSTCTTCRKPKMASVENSEPRSTRFLKFCSKHFPSTHGLGTSNVPLAVDLRLYNCVAGVVRKCSESSPVSQWINAVLPFGNPWDFKEAFSVNQGGKTSPLPHQQHRRRARHLGPQPLLCRSQPRLPLDDTEIL